jgi:hypothetical protein
MQDRNQLTIYQRDNKTLLMSGAEDRQPKNTKFIRWDFSAIRKKVLMKGWTDTH